jgi:hypothetical protein
MTLWLVVPDVSKGSNFFIFRAKQYSYRTLQNSEDEGIKNLRNIRQPSPIETASSSEDLGVQDHLCENETQTL